MADDERREEKQAVTGHGAFCLHVDLVDGDHLPLRRGRLPHHLSNNDDRCFDLILPSGSPAGSHFETPADLQPDGRSDDHALPEVSDTNHEAQVAVSDSDHGVTAEDQRLCSTVRLGRLHKDAT